MGSGDLEGDGPQVLRGKERPFSRIFKCEVPG